MAPDLNDIVQQVKEESEALREAAAAAEETTPVEVTEEVAEPEVQDTTPEEEYADDDSIVDEIPEDVAAPAQDQQAQDSMASLKAELVNQDKSNVVPQEAVSETTPVNGVKAMTMEEIKIKIKKAVDDANVPADAADLEANAMYGIMERYRKRVIVEEGLDEVELNEALTKRLTREIDALETKYGKKGNTVVINVPETEANKIEFSDAQKRKLDNASKIQLVQVEKKTLNTLKLKRLDKGATKLKYIQELNAPYISKYSVPLPLTGEYATFRGAMVVELMQATAEKNESAYSITQKKASLAYNHFIDGHAYAKQNEKGVTVMSYEDFLKTFRYHDLDLMVFAVTCASSGPMTVQNLQCPTCMGSFDREFSISSLLTMAGDDIPDEIKDIYENIAKNHTQPKEMDEIRHNQDELLRMESPLTGNIYDIGAPSIQHALDILSLNGVENDATLYYIATIAFFVQSMFIYDKENDEYIPVYSTEEEEEKDKKNRNVADDENPIATMIEALKMLPQSELIMLNEKINNMSYIPHFKLDSKCPNCGTALSNDINVNQLIFFVDATPTLEVTQP